MKFEVTRKSTNEGLEVETKNTGFLSRGLRTDFSLNEGMLGDASKIIHSSAKNKMGLPEVDFDECDLTARGSIDDLRNSGRGLQNLRNDMKDKEWFDRHLETDGYFVLTKKKMIFYNNPIAIAQYLIFHR